MTNKSDILAYSLSTAVTAGMAVDGGAILGAFIPTLNIKEGIWKTI